MEPFEPLRDLRDPPGATARLRSDRGASDSQLDRLRARPVPPSRASGRPVLPWVAAAVLFALLLGIIANPWFERSVRSRLPGFAPTIAPTVAEVAALEARVATLEARVARPAAAALAVPGGAVAGERLARLEAEVDTIEASAPAAVLRTDKLATDLAALTGRIDANTAAAAAALASATANAERAQSMLVLAAVRRQIDAGQRLGALEPALRRAFAARAPAAVEAVAALGATPTTLAGLRAGLDRLRPELTGAAAATGAPKSWWDGIKASLSLVVVSAPAGDATSPTARVDRAARALAAGNAAAATAEITGLPAATRARAELWLASAERYAAGQRGLAVLDAAMLEPLPLAPVLPLPAASPMPTR